MRLLLGKKRGENQGKELQVVQWALVFLAGAASFEHRKATSACDGDTETN